MDKRGTLRQRGKDSWTLTVSIGFDCNGNRKRAYKTVKAESREEAEIELALFVRECEANDIKVACTHTLESFIELWKRDFAKQNIKRSTMASYNRMISAHLDSLRSRKLNSIKHYEIQRWINELTDSGLSPKSVRNYYFMLHGILKKAVQWEFILKNPADNIELPKRTYSESDYYEKEEVFRLLEILDQMEGNDLNYKVCVLLALFGGLRKGEICGLDECDIDFERNRIHIRQNRITEVGSGVYIDTPKTDSSRRTISLPQVVMNEIERLLEFQTSEQIRLGDRWQESPALIKSEDGDALYPQNLYRWFVRLQRNNGLRHIPFHGLRHTHVSMLINTGCRLDEVSNRVGHAQKTTTLNVYAHLFEKDDTAIAERLNNEYLQIV